MVPVVYFLVVFSIVVHGLSIPALDAFYRYKKVPPISEAEPAEIRMLSTNDALPNNSRVDNKRNSVYVHNRFSRPVSTGPGVELYRWNTQARDSQMTMRSIAPTQDVDYAEKLQSIRFAEDQVHDDANMQQRGF
jgi:NhaP-type Na+/H+ or K+/H+ antiporter